MTYVFLQLATRQICFRCHSYNLVLWFNLRSVVTVLLWSWSFVLYSKVPRHTVHRSHSDTALMRWKVMKQSKSYLQNLIAVVDLFYIQEAHGKIVHLFSWRHGFWCGIKLWNSPKSPSRSWSLLSTWEVQDRKSSCSCCSVPNVSLEVDRVVDD